MKRERKGSKEGVERGKVVGVEGRGGQCRKEGRGREGEGGRGRDGAEWSRWGM